LNSESGLARDQLHYQQSKIEPIEIMQEHLTEQEFQGFLKGNVIKYVLRMGLKGQAAKDADKIVQYSKWLAETVKGGIVDPRRG